MAGTIPILVKVRSRSAGMALAATGKLRPLFASRAAGTGDGSGAGTLGLADGAAPAWFLAEVSDGEPTPWDATHARIADQLGLAEPDIIQAEPDLVQSFNAVDAPGADGRPFAVGGE